MVPSVALMIPAPIKTTSVFGAGVFADFAMVKNKPSNLGEGEWVCKFGINCRGFVKKILQRL